jgi:hypothetical protein
VNRMTTAERAKLWALAAERVTEAWLQPNKWDRLPLHDRPWSPEEVRRMTVDCMQDIHEERKDRARRARRERWWHEKEAAEEREAEMLAIASRWHQYPDLRKVLESEALRMLADGQPRAVADLLRSAAARLDPTWIAVRPDQVSAG